LSRTPKEFDEASPASEFLKMKGFYTMEKLTDEINYLAITHIAFLNPFVL